MPAATVARSVQTRGGSDDGAGRGFDEWTDGRKVRWSGGLDTDHASNAERSVAWKSVSGTDDSFLYEAMIAAPRNQRPNSSCCCGSVHQPPSSLTTVYAHIYYIYICTDILYIYLKVRPTDSGYMCIYVHRHRPTYIGLHVIHTIEMDCLSKFHTYSIHVYRYVCAYMSI